VRVLGLSAFYHDSAAALVVDGRIVAAAQEERFSRRKFDARFPEQAIRFCLDHAGLRLADVDYVVFYDKPFLKFERLLETYLAFAPRGFRSFRLALRIRQLVLGAMGVLLSTWGMQTSESFIDPPVEKRDHQTDGPGQPAESAGQPTAASGQSESDGDVSDADSNDGESDVNKKSPDKQQVNGNSDKQAALSPWPWEMDLGFKIPRSSAPVDFGCNQILWVFLVGSAVPNMGAQLSGPGRPGRLPARGSHRSGRAQFGHPAPQVIGSLREELPPVLRVGYQPTPLSAVVACTRFQSSMPLPRFPPAVR